jgi:hypothetical protein
LKAEEIEAKDVLQAVKLGRGSLWSEIVWFEGERLRRFAVLDPDEIDEKRPKLDEERRGLAKRGMTGTNARGDKVTSERSSLDLVVATLKKMASRRLPRCVT